MRNFKCLGITVSKFVYFGYVWQIKHRDIKSIQTHRMLSHVFTCYSFLLRFLVTSHDLAVIHSGDTEIAIDRWLLIAE